jgi:hypothetical protein
MFFILHSQRRTIIQNARQKRPFQIYRNNATNIKHSTEPSSSLEKPKLVHFNSISKEDLGISILNPDATKTLKKGIVFAKVKMIYKFK